MALRRLSIEQLQISDEASFRHVAIYADLKRALRQDGVTFAAPEPGSRIATDADALLLNLAFYKPGDIAEVLVDDTLTADQLAHNAWHHVAQKHLGTDSVSALLLAESIASAFDAYLVGRLLGHAPDSLFLATQVPAMADAALDAGLEEDGFEELLRRMSDEPEKSFEALRALLFDLSLKLTAASDTEEAAMILEQHHDHPMAALLHHYELAGWVLFTKAHAANSDDTPARDVDRALRQSDDPIAWLHQNWVSAGS